MTSKRVESIYILAVIGAVAAVGAVLAGVQRTGATSPATTLAADEMQSIRRAALDYGEGWYEGDAKRMERALHSELAKRSVYTNPGDGRNRLSQQSAMTLVKYTGRGGGSRSPLANRGSTVTILDVFESAACVKVEGPEWVDYLHMAKWNGQWVIVNVLWEPRPEHRQRLDRALSGVNVKS